MPTRDVLRKEFLEAELSAAGIPFSGVDIPDLNADPPGVVIVYDPLATPEQVAAGEAIKEQFAAGGKWFRRRAMARDTVIDQLSSLLDTNAKLKNFTVAMMAEYLRNNPLLAWRIARRFGQEVAVEEVDPNP